MNHITCGIITLLLLSRHVARVLPFITRCNGGSKQMNLIREYWAYVLILAFQSSLVVPAIHLRAEEIDQVRSARSLEVSESLSRSVGVRYKQTW